MKTKKYIVKSLTFFTVALFILISQSRAQVRNNVSFFSTDQRLVTLRKTLSTENDLMKKGILKDTVTGKDYFTGYAYKTLYDWDQYFESIVQIYMGWPDTYIKNGVTIFLDHQKESGMISRSVPSNQFHDPEHVKPFLCQITLLVFDNYGDSDWMTTIYFNKLKKYLDYWYVDMDKDGNGLSEWMSAPHTGMDNQHERAGWWGDRISEGVDLNCYLVKEARAFADIADKMGKKDIAKLYREKANKKALFIQTKLWDEKSGFFYDRLLDNNGAKYATGDSNERRIAVKSIAGFAPLWAGVATKEQAERMIFDHLLNSDEFWTSWPVSALAKSEPGYSNDKLYNDLGCNWRANTWIPTNYMIYQGLKYYGYNQLASLLANKTEKLIVHAGNREYYNANNGEGIGMNPFWGWSLLGHFFNYEENSAVNITRFQNDGISQF